MTSLAEFGALIRQNIKEHSPAILSVMAGVGTLTTAYLASRATYLATNILAHEKPIEDRKERYKENVKLVWQLYIPTGISAAATITCIVGANRLEARRVMAAQVAFAISERAYSEYRDKVTEEFGESKARSVRDKVAEDRVKSNPPPEVVLVSGNVLCCELFTGRYFQSDMETLKKARNELNARILAHDYATLDDWYYMIKLPYTSYSSEIGWKSGRLMELEFTSVLTEDGRPCLAFDYNYTKPM